MGLLTMRAGDLDRRASIQELTRTPDGGGGYDIIWQERASLWAAVQQMNGKEFLTGGGVQAQRRIVFRVRWLDWITPKHRVAYDGRIHEIHEVRELGRRAGLELHTTSLE
ncbi:phage head closure protein [Neomegalonema sp.]|uniref:phage head closure protein n=1 Tax=Neomegalonema sp. TaxID=2039713 RepID=UPI002606BB16|nr:phage head closure protein [Neomegalonema sp.]MDD2869737.1 phage head closure protein [Neomegalonema sp.]